MGKSPYKPGSPQRYYGKPGDPAICGDRIGTYAGANAHWYREEDPCTECGKAARAYWRELRRRFKDRPEADWPHGTRKCYSDYGCRREECRKANSDYRRANNAARKAVGLRPF